MGAPILMTPELEAVWAAAIALAKERNHREVRDEHMLTSLLFDEDVRRHLGESSDVDLLERVLDERLTPVESYRLNGALVPSIHASVERALRSAARGPLGLRSAFGMRVSARMLVDALLAHADTELQRVMLAPAARSLANKAEISVFLEPSPGTSEDRLIEWTLHFGVSRARATFIVHMALAKGCALVGDLVPDQARQGHALVMDACAVLGVTSPFTLSWGRGSVAMSRDLEQLAMDARATIGDAHRIATERGDRVVSIPHVAFALVDRDVVRQALLAIGVDVDALRESLAGMVARKAEPEIFVINSAAILDDDVDVLISRGRIHAAGGRVRNQHLFAALFLHRETRILLDAHRVKKRNVLLAFLHHVSDDPNIADGDRVEVVFHNDDYTTQEMVVAILEAVFDMNRERAIVWMYRVHEEGAASVGSYEALEARARIARAVAMASEADMPLRITMHKRS